MGDTFVKEGEDDSDEVLDEGIGDKDKPAKTGETVTTLLCGHVTRGMSSQRGKDRTDTRTDDILPTSNMEIS